MWLLIVEVLALLAFAIYLYIIGSLKRNKKKLKTLNEKERS